MRSGPSLLASSRRAEPRNRLYLRTIAALAKKNSRRLSIWRVVDRRTDRTPTTQPTEDAMTTQTISPVTFSTIPASITRYITPCARVLLGLVFFVFGLDGFLHFIPQPTEPPSEPALSFAIGLAKSGYMFPLIKGTEVAVGALLLANRFVSLALVVIAPVIVNIFAFHAFLAPSGIVIASALVALELYLAWVHRRAYRPLFAAVTAAPR